MTMISYAQNREDVLLRRALREVDAGFYVDVGANDPVWYSITKHFYDHGWHGINVEPVPRLWERLRSLRPRDVSLNLAISNCESTQVLYEATDADSGLSTFSAAQAEQHRKSGFAFRRREVPTITLAQLCERHVTRTIDFMSIDVEGHELEVLEGNDWRRFRPRVLVVEAVVPTTRLPSHEKWEHVLLAADYLHAAFDGLNRFYVRVEDRHLLESLAVPVNVLDDFMPYEYQRQLEQVCDTVAALKAAGPGAVNLLTKMVRWQQRYPRVTAIVRRLFLQA